ncbi:MAG: DUF4406 domain-containing protein [Pseudomonadota bacterium]
MSWIMIAGPYSAGAADAAQRAENLSAMNRAALEVFEKGHVPVIGVNMALPVIEVAGHDRYDDLMMPISLALADRCDAILRIGGASAGADAEMVRMEKAGKPVYRSIEQIPGAAQ